MRYLISLAVVMAALWLGLSGFFKPLLLGLGVVSVLLATWMAGRMDVVGTEHNPILFSWRLPIYWAWLVWQIVLANVEVARCILAPGRRLRPRVIEVPVPQKTEIGRVTYANSITLTPGTVSLLLERDRVKVHALTDASAGGVESGDMARRVNWLEGSE